MRFTPLVALLAAGLAAACGNDSDPGWDSGAYDAEDVPLDHVTDEGWTLDGSDTMPPDVPHDPGTEDATCAEFTIPVSETQEVFVVPEDARYMWVKAWGAGGNGELGCDYDNGGLGGFSAAVFEVTPGEEFIVIVGRRGRAGLSGEDIIRFGFGHWGGGGLSGVFTGGPLIDDTSTDRALVIAGGGGGASAPGCQPGGPGNHPDAGGMSSMMGGAGGDDVNGGGGGYEGGVGGARGEGGMGGTGFVHSSALGSTMLHGEPGDPYPPRSDDDDYDGVAGTTEQNGLIHIRFVCEVPVII